MIRIAFFFVVCTLMFIRVSAQQADSLRQILKASNDPLQIISIYHRLAEESGVQNFNEALAFEDSALTIARKINNTEQISITLTHIGSIYRNISDHKKACAFFNEAATVPQHHASWLSDTYLEAGIALLRMTELDTALEVLGQGLAIVQKYPNISTEASLYNAMGNVRREQNQYEEAMRLYIESLKLFEKQKDLRGQTQALSNVSNIHNLLGDTDKALQYALQSLETAKAAKVKSSVAYSLRLLGRIYRKRKQPNEAIQAYSEALNAYKELNARRDIAETGLSMGNIYFDMGKYGMAMEHYKQSILVSKSISDSTAMAYLFYAMGNTLLYTKDYALARKYIDSVTTISMKRDLIYMRMDSYALLAEIYEAEGNYKLGLSNYRNYITIRDSVEQQQNKAQVQELEARYQSEKKDDAIRVLNAENTLQASQQKYLLFILVLLLALAGILYHLYRVKLQANNKLKDLDLIKTRFFTNISHEFRTPLSLILSPLEKHLANTAGVDKEMLSMAHRNAKRLQNLINQLLDLSKIEAGSMEVHLEESDLAKTLRLISSSFSSLADRKGILYKYDIQISSRCCYDRDKLEKICNNLLSNAFKFTPEGGQVYFKSVVENGILLLEIKDSGIGISLDHQKNIFNRFYQTDDSTTRAAEGSGIGLALTKELVELHGGKLSVISNEEAGSTFTVAIPVTREAYAGQAVHKPSGSEDRQYFIDVPTGTVQSVVEDELKPLVLIAEDNDDMQKFLIELLAERYRCLSCLDGLDAFERSQAEVPDLIISDWMMPKMDGLALCEKIKTTASTSHIPVLMLTARADQASKLEGLETGADDYIVKPFDTKELLVRIHNLIEQRKKLRELFSREMILQPSAISLPSRDAEFLSRILNLLEEKHADPDFSVVEIADGVAMSRMQVHRKLKALTNESPGEFLRRFRLERAKQMLSVAGMPVSEVCYNTGFNSLSNFSKIFREFAGVTPSEYQASISEKKEG